jgi:hypothetical protein
MAGGLVLLTAAAAMAGDGPSLTLGGPRASTFINRSSVFGYNEDFNSRSQIYTMWGLYSEGFIPIPPYFALHPPVYYSAPIPRTYGYSPFAYPCDVMTPELQFGEPVVQPSTMTNPYVAPPAGGATDGQTAHAPLRIVNPFVDTAEAQLARYPAATP